MALEFDRRTALKGVGAAALGGWLGPVLAAAPANAVPHDGRVLATGLAIPWGLVFVGSDALVAERDTAKVYLVSHTGGQRLLGAVGGATKVMSMALSPSFAQDKLIYAYIRAAADHRVVRMTWNGSTLGSPSPVFVGIPHGTDHTGGGLAFAPDGMLHIGLGDLGSKEQARDLSSLAGKTLRVRADGSVPGDNPFGSAIWTIGHRNVEGLAFAGAVLYATEFGESETDELNILVKGGDYGWPEHEGGDGGGPVEDPIVTWSPTSYCSPAGIAISNGQAFVGALAGKSLFQVDLSTRAVTRHLYNTYGRIRSVAVAPDGALWITTGNNGGSFARIPEDDRVIRLLPGIQLLTPTAVSAAAVSTSSAVLNWSPPMDYGQSAITGYRVSRDGGSAGGSAWSTTVSAATRSLTFTHLAGGATYNVSVAAINGQGVGPASSVAVAIPATGTPTVPTGVAGRALTATSAVLSWAPPSSSGTSAVTGYKVSRNGGTGGESGWSTTVAASARSLTFTHLTPGSTYALSVSAVNAKGAGPAAVKSVLSATKPGAPVIGTATAGEAGGAITAVVRWGAPASSGGAPVTGYRVRALRMSSTGSVLSTTTSAMQSADWRLMSMTLPQAGNYRFTVQAFNAVGGGAQSARSNQVAGL